MIPIDCVAQTYAWGKRGSESLVSKLSRGGNDSFVLDESKYYAELWMGTHPSGPAKIIDSEISLSAYLSDKPDLVGKVPEGYPENDLPFLFKVLSIRTALSIQAHPDKVLAKRLHASFPEHYKDDNHKPEMVLALTPFEAMCGFRALSEIRELLRLFPEFVHLLKISGYDYSKDSGSEEGQVLRSLFSAYMRSNVADAQFQLELMIERLDQEKHNRSLSELEELMLRLNEQFPGDNGVFAPLLMNYMVLKPGDSFFIGPNVPHAYISGDCIECMALSDNVVRAGLTPKFKDVDTLINMLDYNAQKPNFIKPIIHNNYMVFYRPPSLECPEFEVEYYSVSPNTDAVMVPVPTASLMLMLEGEEAFLKYLNSSASENQKKLIGECRIRTGMVVFISAGSQISVKATATSVVLIAAHINRPPTI